MAIDFRTLGDWVKSDRAKLRLHQGAYGAKLGLSQGQISDLERISMRELSADVKAKLEKRFTVLPVIGDGHRAVTLDDVRENPEVAAELSREQRQELMWSVINLLTLLQDPPGEAGARYANDVTLVPEQSGDRPPAAPAVPKKIVRPRSRAL